MIRNNAYSICNWVIIQNSREKNLQFPIDKDLLIEIHSVLNFVGKMTHNYTCSNNKTVLIDETNALVGGTFALLCAILGITVNSVTMYVIMAIACGIVRR